MINVIITGASGMVGGAVLTECLSSEHVESILVINRRSVNITHQKLKELVVEDFSNLGNYKESLSDYNACFLSLGSLTTFGKVAYENINYHLPLSFAKEVLRANPNISLCYVSGAGADSTESSSIMQLRIKGKTENALLNLGFKSAFMLRPAIIIPEKVANLKFLYKIFYSLAKPLAPVLLGMSLAVKSTDVARAMINLILKPHPENILGTKDIAKLSEG